MYHDAGAFYFYKKSQFFKNQKKFNPKKNYSFVLNQCKVVDIDDIDDFNFAKKLFQISKKLNLFVLKYNLHQSNLSYKRLE